MKNAYVVSNFTCCSNDYRNGNGLRQVIGQKNCKVRCKRKVYYLNSSLDADERGAGASRGNYTDETGVPVTVLTAAIR